MHRLRQLIATLACLGVLLAAAPPALAAQGGGDVANAAQMEEILNVVRGKYVRPIDEEKLYRGALNGALQTLDPYTAYLDPAAYRELKEGLAGKVAGIGVRVQKIGPHLTVMEVIPGTPAAQAGLQKGDQLVDANGSSLVDLDPDVAVQRIRGEPGTSVVLTVRRPGLAEPLIYHLARRELRVSTVESRMLTKAIGYVRISVFGSWTPLEFRLALDELKAAQAQALVIDLRDNPGGLLQAALDMTHRIVPAGPLMQVVGRDGQVQTVSSKADGWDVPKAVLINRHSASASEIMAGAIQDRKAGVLVGEKSFGKGSVQELIPLKNGGALKVTVSTYRTAAGRDINGQGLTPDVDVAAPSALPLVQDRRDLERGVIGLDVLALQERLNALGYGSKAADGIFDEATERDVQKFQRERNLADSGRVEVETRAALNSAVLPDVQLEAAQKALEEQLHPAEKEAA